LSVWDSYLELLEHLLNDHKQGKHLDVLPSLEEAMNLQMLEDSQEYLRYMATKKN